MKKKIIDTAEKSFFEKGFRKVTMDDIASSLGISKKTLYKHVSGKKALAYEVIQRHKDGVFNLLTEVKDLIPDPIERFEKVVIETSNRLSKIDTVFLSDIKNDIPELWKDFENFREKKILSYISEILEEGIANKKIKRGINTKIATLLFLGSVQMIIQPEVIDNYHLSFDEAYSNIREIFLKGVMQ